MMVILWSLVLAANAQAASTTSVVSVAGKISGMPRAVAEITPTANTNDDDDGVDWVSWWMNVSHLNYAYNTGNNIVAMPYNADNSSTNGVMHGQITFSETTLNCSYTAVFEASASLTLEGVSATIEFEESNASSSGSYESAYITPESVSDISMELANVATTGPGRSGSFNLSVKYSDAISDSASDPYSNMGSSYEAFMDVYNANSLSNPKITIYRTCSIN